MRSKVRIFVIVFTVVITVANVITSIYLKNLSATLGWSSSFLYLIQIYIFYTPK